MDQSLQIADPLLPGFDSSDLGSELLESEESQRTRYSGRIVDANMERVRAILAARAMGFGVRQVCEAYRVSPHSLAEIERRHGVQLATLKERLARKFGVFVELGIDRAIAELPRMDVDKLLVSLGIGVDKLQLLDGAPTAIVSSPEEAARFSVAAVNARLARARNVTGSAGREDGQTRAELLVEAAPSPGM